VNKFIANYEGELVGMIHIWLGSRFDIVEKHGPGPIPRQYQGPPPPKKNIRYSPLKNLKVSILDLGTYTLMFL
jgi:hypothetical protein